MMHVTMHRLLLVAAGLVVLLTSVPTITARPNEPGDISAVADALKYLQELDRYYAQVARPRYARSGSEPPELSKVERAIKLLQLQHLDRFYSHHSRPRFGKRAEVRDAIQDEPVESDWVSRVLSRR